MNKKIGLIFFIILFFTPFALALNNDIFDISQMESAEELSSQLKSSHPDFSSEEALDVAEAVYLIRQLEREMILTDELLGIREEKKLEEKEAPVKVETPEISEETAQIKKIVREEIEEVSSKEIKDEEPKEIIVAKHVSTKPQEAVPEKERPKLSPSFLQRDLIKRLKEVDAPPPTQTYQYSLGELQGKNYSITIEKEQRVIIPAPGLKRFLVTDPKVLEASKGVDEVSVVAIRLGKSFLHIWDKDGRKTLNVKVIQKDYKTHLETRLKILRADEMKSFKVRYSFDRYRLNSNSENPDRSYHYTEYFHRLGVTGETPWGMLKSAFEYQGKGHRKDDFNRDLSHWSTYLTGPDIEVSVGDVGAYFSSITLPQVSYQGFRFRNPDEKKINYDMMWGARGASMWGNKVVDWKGENYFYGAKFQIEPAEFINLKTTLMRSQGNDLDTSERVIAGGFDLNFFDEDIKLDCEYARGQYGDAMKIKSDLKSEEYNLDFKGEYRDIANDYQLVYDQGVPNRGEIGYFLDLNYYPLKFLRITGEYNKFRNRASPSENHNKHNFDKKAIVKVDVTKTTQFTWSIWDRKRLGTTPKTLNDGQSFHIQHGFNILGRSTNVYALYQPTKYKSIDNADTSYEEDRVSVGMKMNVFKNLYFDISHLWHSREISESHESGTARTFSTGLAYSSQIFDTPFYGSLSLRYKNDLDVVSAISLSSEEKYKEMRAELKYKPSSDMEMYLRVNMKDVGGVVDKTKDRDEMRIYCGGTYLFDTTLKFSKGGAVEGYVFKDENINGTRDDGEELIAGVDIYAGDKKYTTTDRNGYYKFDRVKGIQISILLDTRTLPEKYSPTTANPAIVKLEKGMISEAIFGVAARTEISGRAFNDVNMNGERDEEDQNVQDLRLTLDDGRAAYTDMHGYYSLSNVGAGERMLTIDSASLPRNLLPLSSPKRTIVTAEGESYKEDFALYALRTVIGTVFVDKNENGEFDSGEECVGDVEVMVGDNSALTDEMGRFFLKKLKGGLQKVEINPESIPEEYEIIGDAFKEVFLLPEGEIKEDVDFALRKE